MITNILIWIIAGGLLGWQASMIMRTNAQPGVLLDIAMDRVR